MVLVGAVFKTRATARVFAYKTPNERTISAGATVHANTGRRPTHIGLKGTFYWD